MRQGIPNDHMNLCNTATTTNKGIARKTNRDIQRVIYEEWHLKKDIQRMTGSSYTHDATRVSDLHERTFDIAKSKCIMVTGLSYENGVIFTTTCDFFTRYLFGLRCISDWRDIRARS
jgi:hypothetical protein